MPSSQSAQKFQPNTTKNQQHTNREASYGKAPCRVPCNIGIVVFSAVLQYLLATRLSRAFIRSLKQFPFNPFLVLLALFVLPLFLGISRDTGLLNQNFEEMQRSLSGLLPFIRLPCKKSQANRKIAQQNLPSKHVTE